MDGLSWFPQDLSGEFYILKGVIALIATVGLVWHMHHTWPAIARWGQRLCYLALLYFAVLLTAAALEQTAQDALVNLRNLGAIGGAILLLLAAAVSIAESRKP